MAKNTIQIEIFVNSKGAASIKEITGGLSGIGKVAATGVVAGVGAATAAVAGFGVAGLNAFMGFESGMNEVFTLMPNITESAMDKMTQQTKEFAAEFGVLPDKVVPALYQSISAGVPPNNVFDFLGTAQKAAVGGVTELETAVNGISSVVNAYGADIINATEASDLMFTAVKLGKTDFNQLSKSLFNVIPTTSALGVGFGDVTAGIAALTAQGTPTSVATTQMRQMFVELSKATSKTAKTFEDAAGVSFKEFIAQGGNTQQALQILEEAAAASGKNISDLFGSVEAGNAALGLTGKGTDRFTANLEEMANAAGATDTAYNRMETGIGRTLDKIKARGAVFLTDVGDRIAPAFSRLGVGVMAAFGPITDFVLGIFDVVGPVIDDIIGKVINLFDAFQAGGAAGLFEALGLGPEALTLLENIKMEFSNLAVIVSGSVTPVLQQIAANIMPALSQAITFVNQHWEGFRNALVAIIAVIAGATVFTTITATIAAIANPVTLVIAAIGLLAMAWTENWGGIRDILTNVWNQIQPYLVQLWDWLQIQIPIALQTLSDFWQTILLPALMNVWAFVQNTVLPLSKELFDWLMTNIPEALQTLSDLWQTVLLPAIESVWAFIQDPLMPIFLALADLLEANVSKSIETVQALFENVLLPAMQSIWDFISSSLTPIFQSLGDALSGPLSSALDKVKSLFSSLKDAAGSLKNAISGVADRIRNLADSIRNLSLPAWLTPGSPTPLEIGLRGITDALGGVNAMTRVAGGISGLAGIGSIVSAGTVLGGGSAAGGSATTNNYYYNQTINSNAPVSTVIQDFETMRAFTPG